MYLLQRPLFFWVETPLHAGSGTDLGIVDLPIQREKHTNYPKIEASGIKGCLREYFEQKLGPKEEHIHMAFGPAEGSDEHTASALGFSDARLLLFPVQSMRDVFVWITCPHVVTRFAEELKLCEFSPNFAVPQANTVSNLNAVCVKTNENNANGTLVLEEYAFEVQEADPTKNLAAWLHDHLAKNMAAFWQNKILTSLVVLTNEDFRDFVTMSTEVTAHTRIDDTRGTVANGALWYEEYLPTDSILYSLVFAGSVFRNEDDKHQFAVTPAEMQAGKKRTLLEAEKVLAFFEDHRAAIVQIGGNATVGKGLVRTIFPKVEAKKEVAHA